MARASADSADEFPPSLGRVATRELALNGFTRFADLTTVTRRELLALHGVGPKAIRILDEHLAERGMTFAE